MSITEELREYTKHYSVAGSKKDTMLSSIADRIDAEHEKAIHELNGFAEVSVLLPKDVNGEPIHVGDEMECVTPLHPDMPKAFKVQRIDLESSGWTLVAYPASYKPENCRHVKQATVEDVLSEMLDAVDDDRYEQDRIIAEYAVKLREMLAGDAE